MIERILATTLLLCSIIICVQATYYSYYSPFYRNVLYRSYTPTYRAPAIRQPISKEELVYITDKYGQTSAVSRTAYLQKDAAMPHNSCGTCAYNAKCAILSGIATCACLRGYEGDPLTHCNRLECLDNSECGSHLMCKNGRCVNPCDGICGIDAICQVNLHIPVCSCPPGYTGHPTQHCRRFDPSELCEPNPCGPNTKCTAFNLTTTCECLPGFTGSPTFGCKHECEYDGDCSSHMACIDNRCQNPCYSRCGLNAECEGVRNHAAICTCPKGYFGRADISCRAECTSDSECPANKPRCSLNTCKDPCEEACGINAHCELHGLTPVCSCAQGRTGNPYVNCRPYEKEDLCSPNPCGVNTKCNPGFDNAGNERPVCTCLHGYFGDPLVGCLKGDCEHDEECSDSQACIDFKCQNACISQCGKNAECSPRYHIAACSCPPGYNGDALENCRPVYSEQHLSSFY